jgi:UDP-glucose 4-epimerase
LLGRHVEAAVTARNGSSEIWRPEKPFDWLDTTRAVDSLQQEAAAFFRRAAEAGSTWRLIWCAGTSLVATTPELLAKETALLSRFLSEVALLLAADPRLAPAGMLFFASSAGGVYAASPDPPFHEESPVRPLAPYGREKLAQEQRFSELAQSCGLDLLIGRLSNLYGPSRNLAKPQGLVAHVGSAALRREPVSIYVPLDTIRDYLFAPDAGRMIVETVARREEDRRRGQGQAAITKIFASEIDTTVAAVLGAWRQALRRRPLVAFARSPTTHLQPRILSFRSRVWPDIRGQPTRLSLGIDAVRRDQLAQMLSEGVPRLR